MTSIVNECCIVVLISRIYPLPVLPCPISFTPLGQPAAALAVSQGSKITIFPSVTVASETVKNASPAELGPSKSKKAKTDNNMSGTSKKKPRPIVKSAPKWPPVESSHVISWEAHDHNISGISTAPFPGPVSSTASLSSWNSRSQASTAPASRNGVSVSSVNVENGVRGTQTGYGVPGSDSISAVRPSAMILYTSSLDGICKEWEVTVGMGDGDAAGPKPRCVHTHSDVAYVAVRQRVAVIIRSVVCKTDP